ncbi:ABC-type nitrate/sulfonate/bicarbonate transport system, permease component [Amycolatopsis arida]|uniref:ABC-type nitrate/sulfonate/bicarbonate transport system, permease component n=1 Tax=Amycolatopsis arida TaxID=587909 RepID=A0A1I5MFP9_9PSEU|nr:ABC transporter permease [Amycolatopsis arida]TDX94062.1 ABC-type nitrate/sulfonate/bicarbonate transport system permease component [Amycolatopsis arida]SFP07786.1 ABC-type nitrate/sulfonate/bicarbonate transport system, permease component [Amycolatopsis arida]
MTPGTPGSPATPPGATRREVPGVVLGAAGLAGLAALLEVVPRAGLVDARFLPPFSHMAAALGDQLGSAAFWPALTATLRGWSTGLAIAMVAGVTLGIVIGSVPVLRAATSSTIEFLRPIPSVALIPLAVLLFGTDPRSTLILVVYASFWQVLVQVLHGVADVDPVARDTARSYRFSPWTQVRTVVWPTALPYVMTGFRLAAAVALILEITGELVIGSPGLGKSIAVAQSSGAVAAMYALVIVTGLIGVAVNLLVRATERRVLRWHPSVRGEVTA